MNHREELHSALGIVAVALGTDFVSGRTLAAFYAQTARASWLGVLCSGLIFGVLTALISGLARRTGAGCLTDLFRRLPGGGIGWGATALYYVILIAAACMMLGSAGHVGALALPAQHAALYAGGCAVLFAAMLDFSGGAVMRAAGGAFVICALLFEVALLVFGDLPDKLRFSGELVLRLQDNWAAALAFSALHTAVGICLSAGVTVRFSSGRIRPSRLGLYAGGIFMLLLFAGNAVLRAGEPELLVLKIPFTALSSGWSSGGFYTSVLLEYFAAVVTLAGLGYGLIPKQNSRNFIEK